MTSPFHALLARARKKHQFPALAFIFGFSLSVSVAVWQFGMRIPEVHLGYLIPIALAATLWGSAFGIIVAMTVWAVNVGIIWIQVGGSPFFNEAEHALGLLTLGAAYVAIAVVVGRYAENLARALERAESKAREAVEAERQARRYASELEDAYVQTVLALAKAVEAKDTHTADHAERLADLAERVARRLGINDPGELQTLRFGAILHDVGKIGVPDSVLKKPGPLDPDEWELMKRHPVIGCQILEAVARLQTAGKIVRHHHERWDGKGYPDGLVGEAIPLASRIVTAVDSYHAIMEPRVYKPARSRSEAIAELESGAGRQFDARVVQVLVELLREEEIGRESVAPPLLSEPPAPVAPLPELELLSRLIGVGR